MLGRLRMTVEDAITCYLDLAEQVFGFTVPFPTFKRLQPEGKAIYDASILERCIKETCFKYYTEAARRRRYVTRARGMDLAMCSSWRLRERFADGCPNLFRSYKTGVGKPPETYIVSLRAWTLSTTLLSALFVTEAKDGGLSGSNNPSKLARHEVRGLFPGRQIGCFLSVATGVGKVYIAKACARLIANCEVVEDNVRRDVDAETEKGEENPYFRFSVVRGVGGTMFDEWRERESLIGVTRTYLRSSEQQSEIKRCTDVLLVRTKAAVDSRERDCSLL
ncbi:hypothetical protein JB92DRAFT_2836247 [Gautieria morchelliformis]|nr:hypothetical protein JB92DRAFT_2836247 [Gautieria morchelliformis]